MEKFLPAIVAALCVAVLALVAGPVVIETRDKIIAGLQFKMPEDRAGRPLNQR